MRIIAKLAALFAAVMLVVGFTNADAAERRPVGSNVPKFCPMLDSGRIAVQGEPTTSITVDAPEGTVIDGYCAQRFTRKGVARLVVVPVEPARSSVTITVRGTDIGHYSLALRELP